VGITDRVLAELLPLRKDFLRGSHVHHQLDLIDPNRLRERVLGFHESLDHAIGEYVCRQKRRDFSKVLHWRS